MKKFEIPTYYKSSFIGAIKEQRKITDPRKKDFTPTLLDFGTVKFLLARHFGFCYGVENAIEISYKAVEENPDKRIYLLSQMIHNQEVNKDLQSKGIQFILDTEGNNLIDWSEITKDDVIIIPAFGTSLETMALIKSINAEMLTYNTTCPFVEKVWKQSAKLGVQEFSVIIHGKAKHEETRATFSHSADSAPSVVIKDMSEAIFIGEIIQGKRSVEEFYTKFEGKYSEGFNAELHLDRVGVVNQTTMLATETHAIAEYFKQVMLDKYGEEELKNHFADTRDTLCYATNDNQEATYGLLKAEAHAAFVVGGYNSSNTSHLVELCEEKVPTYYINSAAELKSKEVVHHWDFRNKQLLETTNYLPGGTPTIILTSGASCPDTLVDELLDKLLDYYGATLTKEEVLQALSAE